MVVFCFSLMFFSSVGCVWSPSGPLDANGSNSVVQTCFTPSHCFLVCGLSTWLNQLKGAISNQVSAWSRYWLVVAGSVCPRYRPTLLMFQWPWVSMYSWMSFAVAAQCLLV